MHALRRVRSGREPSLRLAFAVLAAVVAAVSVVALAPAAPFPAERYTLVPVGGEPLKSGFVENIHPDGPQIYARHVYVLNGARSDASYQAVISIWTSNVECSGAPTFVLPVAVLQTNGAGNGRADVVHTPEDLEALGIRGLTIGGEVTFLRGGSPAYATGCRVVELD
jgi:hypothetical protein